MRFTLLICSIAAVSAVSLDYVKIEDINYDAHLKAGTDKVEARQASDAKGQSEGHAKQEADDHWRGVKPEVFGP